MWHSCFVSTGLPGVVLGSYSLSISWCCGVEKQIRERWHAHCYCTQIFSSPWLSSLCARSHFGTRIDAFGIFSGCGCIYIHWGNWHIPHDNFSCRVFITLQSLYLYHSLHITLHICKLNSHLTCFQRGFIATSMAEVLGSNPVGASEFFHFITARITFTCSPHIVAVIVDSNAWSAQLWKVLDFRVFLKSTWISA